MGRRPSYRPNDLYPSIECRVVRERSAVSTFLHDHDAPATLDQVAQATGLTLVEAARYLQDLIEVEAVESPSSGLYEWWGTC